MALRVFPVVGEALNFGARRLETIARVAALPIGLSLVFNMATVFLYLSVANGRVITFADVASAGATWPQVVALAGKAAQDGLNAMSGPIWTIYIASLVINAILISSFMAPLIRYAGLGEKPAPGLLRLPFGGDQLRFLGAGLVSTLLFVVIIYAPMLFATSLIIDIISAAVSAPYVNFPDASSLHTIDVVSGADAMAMRGTLWIYEYGLWGAALGVLLLVTAGVLFFHVRPTGEDRTAGIGFIGRVLGVIGGLAAIYGLAAALGVFFVTTFLRQPYTPTLPLLIIAGAVALTLPIFVSLRLFPYAGVAVCRRSMGLGGTLRVTRRFNVVRLGAAFLLTGVILFGMIFGLVTIGGWAGMSALSALYSLAASVAGFVGVNGDSVLNFFRGVYAVVTTAGVWLWTLFTYGVTAGLLGRLYRESERL
jgi:hypothetical protein